MELKVYTYEKYL